MNDIFGQRRDSRLFQAFRINVQIVERDKVFPRFYLALSLAISFAHALPPECLEQATR